MSSPGPGSWQLGGLGFKLGLPTTVFAAGLCNDEQFSFLMSAWGVWVDGALAIGWYTDRCPFPSYGAGHKGTGLEKPVWWARHLPFHCATGCLPEAAFLEMLALLVLFTWRWDFGELGAWLWQLGDSLSLFRLPLSSHSSSSSPPLTIGLGPCRSSALT